MKLFRIGVCLVLAILSVPLSSSGQTMAASGNHGFDLTITNIRNTIGYIRIGIFTDENGYPDKPVNSVTVLKDTVRSGRMRLIIPVGKAGYFSITLLDDENGNGKMDYLFSIMPKEGFGFSNNPRIALRKAPPFSETLIHFGGGTEALNIKMVYIY